MKNFHVGSDVYAIMMADQTVTWYLGDRVFPLIASETTQYPFAVYRRVSYTRAGDNKDGCGEGVTLEIAIVDPNYSTCVKIADAVAECLAGATSQNIDSIQLTNASEDFVDDANVQRLTFAITLTDN